MSLKQNNQIGSNLIGGATAVLLAIPVAAFFGSIFGDTYQARSTVYILILAWVVAGAFAIGYVSKRHPKRPHQDSSFYGLLVLGFGLFYYSSTSLNENKNNFFLKAVKSFLT